MGLRIIQTYAERGIDSVYEPHVSCDWCGQRITEGRAGNVNFYTESYCGKPADAELIFVHKVDCQWSWDRARFGSRNGWVGKMAYQSLDRFLFCLTNNTDTDAAQVRKDLGLPEPEPRRGLSPIEQQFLDAWEKTGGPRITAQHRVSGEHGQYRLDFALVEGKIAIELDGFLAHHTTEQIAKDRKRQRDIEALGWRVIRFGGKEIHHDVGQCVREIQAAIGGP